MISNNEGVSTPTVTIVMPCLNEAETLEQCILKAQRGLENAHIHGEILIADNGSTDGSIEIAKRYGATVVHVQQKGYGSALRAGIEAASSPWIIMGDSDDSYDFSHISGFIEKLKEGNDLVMGCRLPTGGGKILPGAMPWKNRWIGNPVLSFLGRTLFQTPVHDFHCGMRAFTKKAYDAMQLHTTGMEFASEMVMKATLWKMKVVEVPITLHPDGRSRPPHLKPWRDGWRHLRFMLIYSPRWLFLIPGLIMMLLGLIATLALYSGPITIKDVVLDVGTMLLTAMLLIIGFQLVVFAFLAKIFAIGAELMPEDKKLNLLFRYITLEKGLAVSAMSVGCGLLVLIAAFIKWKLAHFGFISYSENMHRLILGMTWCVLGIQGIFASFFFSVLGLKKR